MTSELKDGVCNARCLRMGMLQILPWVAVAQLLRVAGEEWCLALGNDEFALVLIASMNAIPASGRRYDWGRLLPSCAVALSWSAVAIAMAVPINAAATILGERPSAIDDPFLSQARSRAWRARAVDQTVRASDNTVAALSDPAEKLGTVQDVGAAESKLGIAPDSASAPAPSDRARAQPDGGEDAGVPRSSATRADDNASIGPLAQFQLPPAGTTGGPAPQRHGGISPPRPVTQYLKYQYSFGSESDFTYRQDPDLDRRLKDDSLIAAPQLNGYIIYRPTDWLEMMAEMFLERELPIIEQDLVTLPTGEKQPAPQRHTLLGFDQLFVTMKHIGPVDATLGRRNFEDDRHWLFDTALDTALAKIRLGDFHGELSISRKELLDLDLLKNNQSALPRNIDPAAAEGFRTGNYIFYGDYRGIPGMRLGAYTVFRDDRSGADGRPLWMGVRANGKPSEKFSFWSELAFLRGTDGNHKKFKAQAFDVGATYRFPKWPLAPSVTLGYAYGTGDKSPNDPTNYEFRQTGLQSNEAKLAGVSAFKYYGEAIDPELSDLQIFTAAIGFRPASNIFVDLVYHKYRLNEFADEIRNWAFTQQMEQVDSVLSKDVGSEVDLIIGFRNVFGLRRLGVDLRVGVFYPGNAFLRNDGAEDDPIVRRANTSISILAKLWF